MAERRPPGFTVDLGFYDSAEVLSIPRRIRVAAVGAWTLCGSFSANKLSDGLVSAEVQKQLGVTDAIRQALFATKGKEGEPSPLWIPADAGAIQFTRWTRWQRTYAEVNAYRARDLTRKQTARRTAREPSSSENDEMSARTSPGRSQPVRAEHRDPKTKTETEITTYVGKAVTDPNARDSIAATAGADLVRKIIPPEHPIAVQTMLRLRANELIHSGQPCDVVEDALRLWLTKTLGPNALPSLVSDVIKTRGARAAPTNGLTAGEAKVAGWMNLGQNPDEPKAINQ